MIKFPFKREKGEKFLVLDIGTEAVKSLIFRREEGKNIILGSDLKDYYPLGIIDEKDFEKKEMEEIVSEVITQAKKKAKINIKGCVTFWRLPGTILKERVVPLFWERKDPKKIISQEKENEICKEITNETREKISKGIFQKSGILPQDLLFLDTKILQRRIDGYEINQLAGFSGRNLELRALFAFLPKNYLESIKRITKKLRLGSLKIILESESLISAFSDQKLTGIFLDIGGKLTQITLMKEGKLIGFNSFEMGGEFFSQKLAQTLGIDKARAEDIKIRYAKRILSEEVRERIRDMLSFSIQAWFDNLKIKLKEISEKEEKILPSTIFLLGGGSLLPEVEEILSGGNWEDLSILSQPKVNFISLKDFKNIEDKSNIINIPRYIPTLLLCYVNV